MIIELTGPPGSGKSLATRKMCAILSDLGKRVYYPREGEPRHHRYWQRFATGSRWLRRLAWTMVFLGRHARLVASTVLRQWGWPAPLREKLYLLWGFLSAGALDQALKNHAPAEAIVVYEEGLLQRGASLFSGVNEAGSIDVLTAYAEHVPMADLLISVEAPPDVCLQRVVRRGVRPKRTLDLDNESIQQFITNQCTTISRLMNIQHSKNVRVVTIDNSGSEDSLEKKLRDAVQTIICS